MKATLYFLVEVENDYNNYVDMSNGQQLAVNNSIDSVEHLNREGTIIDAPKGAIVSKGDKVLFHHNICRNTFGLKGKRRRSNFHINANNYFIPFTEIFMVKYKNKKAKWEAVDPVVFIEPLPVVNKTLPNGLVVLEDSYKEMKDLIGKVAFPNKQLLSLGVKEGDMVSFEEYSEHEYTIEGKVYYKMKTKDILGVL